MTKATQLNVDEVRTELEKIASLILTAARLINDGRMIDLDALTCRTDATCNAAVSLPPEDGKSILGDLEAIIGKLDDLAAQLSARFGNMPNLQNEAAPGVAASAYGRLQGTGR